MAKKICRNCKMFTDKDVCPNCKSSEFTDSYKGRIYILDVGKSEVAKKINISAKGEYAIKI